MPQVNECGDILILRHRRRLQRSNGSKGAESALPSAAQTVTDKRTRDLCRLDEECDAVDTRTAVERRVADRKHRTS